MNNVLTEWIKCEELAEAVGNILESRKAPTYVYTYGEGVAQLIKDISINRGMYRESDGSQMYMEALYAASFLFKAYEYEVEGTIVPSMLLQARDDFALNAPEIHEQIVDAVCSCIEGHYGFLTPIKKLIPAAGTPTQLFSDAVFVYDYYNK